MVRGQLLSKLSTIGGGGGGGLETVSKRRFHRLLGVQSVVQSSHY